MWQMVLVVIMSGPNKNDDDVLSDRGSQIVCDDTTSVVSLGLYLCVSQIFFWLTLSDSLFQSPFT